MIRVIAAGGTFAGTTLIGLLIGIWLAGRTGQQLWVPGCLLAGLVVGGVAAVRTVLRESG